MPLTALRAHLLVDAPVAALGAAGYAASGSWLPLAAAGGFGLAAHVLATVHPRCGLYAPVSWRLPTNASGIALTFDDGPHPEHTPRILDLLAAAGQHATFFVIGEHVRQQGALLRRTRAEGHALGLHSLDHSRWFNCWSQRRVRDDLTACAALIADATGEPAPRLFRPPVGLKNPLVGAATRTLGLTLVTWSARAWDTCGASAEAIAARLLAGTRTRAILLAHDGHEPGRAGDRSATVAAVERVLPELAQRGLPSRALACTVGGALATKTPEG